jgi:hypothetical protein
MKEDERQRISRLVDAYFRSVISLDLESRIIDLAYVSGRVVHSLPRPRARLGPD